MKNGKIDKYLFEGGYAQATTGAYTDSFAFYYYSMDHLGNVRSVVTKNPSTGVVSEVQQTHYYPFGGVIADISTGTSVQNKLYNGNELDSSNNLWWYDYWARQYDPTAPRFIRPDPMAEKYYGWNTYAYCLNNPVKLIDVKGLFSTEAKALEYAESHEVSSDNVHFANDKEEWYVSFGEDGEGYESGGTLIRDFGTENAGLETMAANINNAIDGATKVKELGEYVSFGNNWKFYGINKGPFHGNQYVSVTNVYPIASKISTGCMGVSLAQLSYDTTIGFFQDGCRLGNNTINALGENISSIGGAYAGGIYGAKLGTAIYPGWGTLIGGMIGAVAGGMGGEYLWQRINK